MDKVFFKERVRVGLGKKRRLRKSGRDKMVSIEKGGLDFDRKESVCRYRIKSSKIWDTKDMGWQRRGLGWERVDEHGRELALSRKEWIERVGHGWEDWAGKGDTRAWMGKSGQEKKRVGLGWEDWAGKGENRAGMGKSGRAKERVGLE